MDHPAERFDVMVVGGGVAGLSAALQLGRARRRVLVVDGRRPRNGVAPFMHGLLGRDHTSPLDLLSEGRAEVEGYGGVCVEATVSGATVEDGRFVIEVEGGARYEGRRLVIATGLVDELPDIPGLRDLWGTGVVTCPYCDGYESRDRAIAVVATQPMSVFQAKLLRQWSPEVSYFSQGVHGPDGDDLAAFAARGIRVDPRPVAALASSPAGGLEAVVTEDGDRVSVDRVFIAPRSRPRDEILRGLGAAATDGWVQVDGAGQTSVPGLYAVGNVVDIYANVAMSIGAGSATGGAINADLTMDDTSLAVANSTGNGREL